jgi:hypothetical protein
VLCAFRIQTLDCFAVKAAVGAVVVWGFAAACHDVLPWVLRTETIYSWANRHHTEGTMTVSVTDGFSWFAYSIRIAQIHKTILGGGMIPFD